jgi:hypothetical protein
MALPHVRPGVYAGLHDPEYQFFLLSLVYEASGPRL